MRDESETMSCTLVSLAKALDAGYSRARRYNVRHATDTHHLALMYALIREAVEGGQLVNRSSGGGGPFPPPTAAGGRGCETHAAAHLVSAPEPSARHLRGQGLLACRTSGKGSCPAHGESHPHRPLTMGGSAAAVADPFLVARGGGH